MEKCRFAQMHIFPYSRRPGTPADKMPGQHPNAVKEDRARRAIALAEELSKAYRGSLIGSVQAVLFEQREGDWDTGHAPNYVKIYVPHQQLHGKILGVKITNLWEDGVQGQLF